ncbi:hypothetical protein LSM04_004602 [Trypanosoma melophagium]|uniref:uncharacterized protein n=1 Tax=Trypanosoma melophagium TaxID=715481 RepID=UPI00351A144C|nr:hypothetical protein LSM04_004602 [Trypanosoma melophagium]
MPRNRQERHTAGARRKSCSTRLHARRKRRQEGDTAFSTIAAAPHAANCTPSHSLHTLAAQAEGQVDVLWLDRHAAAVDARAVGVGKQRHDVRLCGLLRREDRAALEAQTLLLCTRHLTHQTLERRLLQQQVSGALELADLTQRHGPRTPATLRVLHTRCR